MKENIKGMLHYTRQAFGVSLVLMLVCGLLFPLLLSGLSAVLFPHQAEGSLIEINGKAVAAENVGQEFTEDYYFQGRPSAVGYNNYTEEELKNGEYSGVSSGSYNYGNSNPELEKRIQKDLDEFLEKHPGVKAEDVPSDLLTASGSGLDPHISPKAAEIQIPYVAENSGLSEEEVTEIVEENTEHKVLGIFGEERVNVLKCNLAVANAMGILE